MNLKIADSISWPHFIELVVMQFCRLRKDYLARLEDESAYRLQIVASFLGVNPCAFGDQPLSF